MIMRTNTVNGRRYRDDPTIMSWELMNEPRCRGCGMRLQVCARRRSVIRACGRITRTLRAGVDC